MRAAAGGVAVAVLLFGASASLAADLAATTVQGVVVTARKRPETLLSVPESVSVFSAGAISQLDLRSFTDFATKTPDLSFAYGNGATAIGDARTIAIRGVSGPNTTGVYIDETPVPDSLDPHLVDLDRIEVLRGPQGTLYGESSLGGNVKFVSKAASLDEPSAWMEADAGATSHGGSPDLGGQGAGDLVIDPGRAALRISGFWDQDAGYLTRTFPDPSESSVRLSRGDQGAQQSSGGSAALHVRLNEAFEVGLRLIAQDLHDQGFPAAFAPLPAFQPISTLDRAFDLQPYMSDRWLLPSLTLSYQGRGWRIDSSTSGFLRTIRELEDSSAGTAQMLQSMGAVVPSQPYAWRATRKRSQISHETRVSFDGQGPLSGLAGVFLSNAKDAFVIPPISAEGLAASGAWPSDLLWRSDIRDSEQDVALFGEAYLHLRQHVVLTLGARQYWLHQGYHLYADGFVNGGVSDGAPGKNSESGLKAALSWEVPDRTLLYASASKGFRAGGSGQAVIPACQASLQQIGLTEAQAGKYDSDTVWSYEAGAKTQVDGGRLLLTTAAYHLDWNRIQQAVFLPSCAYIITANAGAAAADGGEIELAGELARGLQIRLGLALEDARITKLGDTGQAVGSRVYQAPRETATAALDWRRPLKGQLIAVIGADYSWVGDSVSNNSGGSLQLVRPAYGLLNARLGLRNLTNARPNLGDIGYIGYEQFEPSGLPLPQAVTLPPISARLELRRSF
jgi:iron complex outermembrane receptor protein